MPAAQEYDASQLTENPIELEASPRERPASTKRPHWNRSLPPSDCLTAADMVMPDEAEINHNAMLIQNTLLEFDLETTVIDVQVGADRHALCPAAAQS